MFSSPWYGGNHYSHNPYSSYNPYQQRYSSPVGQYDEDRARALAEQRARRAQWLPDEDDNDEDDWEYNQLGPRERAYVEARRRQAVLEQERLRQQEAARQRAAALQEQQQEAAKRRLAIQQELERRQMEEYEARRKFVEARKRENQQRREEALERLVAAERERMQREGHARSPSQQRADINQRRTPSPQSSARKTTPSPQPVYTEEHENAASRIQQQFRIHQSYRTLHTIADEFETLRTQFVYPTVVDFQKPGEEGTISLTANHTPADVEEGMELDADDAKLAFSSQNFPLHGFVDAMDKLLMRLDGVESWGEKGIRDTRRSIVKDIEKESAKLEKYWKRIWADHVRESSKATTSAQSEPEEVEEMKVVEELQPEVDEGIDTASEPDIFEDVGEPVVSLGHPEQKEEATKPEPMPVDEDAWVEL